jgi:hypothetical protein
MIFSEIIILFRILKIMKKTLNYYFQKYAKKFKILACTNMTFYLLNGTLNILATFYIELVSDSDRVRTRDNDYSTSDRFLWVLATSIVDSLFLFYIYYNFNHIRLRDYVYDLLAGMGKLDHFYDASRFIIRS